MSQQYSKTENSEIRNNETNSENEKATPQELLELAIHDNNRGLEALAEIQEFIESCDSLSKDDTRKLRRIIGYHRTMLCIKFYVPNKMLC